MKSSATAPKIKLLIWDLDHTLWNGILSENDQITLKPKVVEVIKELDRRGVLQSIASKNNFDDAWAKLEEFGLSEYFLYPQINWAPKSEAVATIVDKISIGINTVAFIDDQDFEREEVRFVHPQVRCYQDSKVAEILNIPDFLPQFVTPESAFRRSLYQTDILRKEEEEKIGSNQSFLESLNMQFKVSLATVGDLQRVEELTQRTNQLNATGYTYSYEELEAFITSPNHLLLVAELVDKFGTYGKIGVALIEIGESAWTLKLLLMSCRVMSRGVGKVLLSYISNQARQAGKSIQAEFRPTDRNRAMYITYRFSGFEEIENYPDGGQLLANQNTDIEEYPEYVNVDFPDSFADA